jgi:hypothetical protein
MPVALSGQGAGANYGILDVWFQVRCDHLAPLAFWIRYTLFSPHHRPDDAIGELWAVFFDGETGNHIAVKREVPIGDCRFETSGFSVTVGDASLGPGRLSGSAGSNGHDIAWDLSFEGSEPPLFLLPTRLYDTALPKAKSLVGLPQAVFHGTLQVDGRALDIDGWTGSQNHNWGAKHTDEYAWGQVAGFDTDASAFLEVATARLRIGPLWTPLMTLIVLRHQGKELRFNGLLRSIRARASRNGFVWTFASGDENNAIEGTIDAVPSDFVGLCYYNPPGGEKHCLNSKIAACELRVIDRRTGASETLSTRKRAAFEILTDRRDHGIEIRA